MSKPTMRRSGERRVTLRVRQDLSLDDLAYLFWRASTNGYKIEREGFPRNSASDVRDAVVSFVKHNGSEYVDRDDEEFNGSAQAQTWAYENVARAFGFDELEIPEPKIDERAARRLAFFDAGGHPDDFEEDDADCEADHAECFRS